MRYVVTVDKLSNGSVEMVIATDDRSVAEDRLGNPGPQYSHRAGYGPTHLYKLVESAF